MTLKTWHLHNAELGGGWGIEENKERINIYFELVVADPRAELLSAI